MTALPLLLVMKIAGNRFKRNLQVFIIMPELLNQSNLEFTNSTEVQASFDVFDVHKIAIEWLKVFDAH